jgi:hypothetical protein
MQPNTPQDQALQLQPEVFTQPSSLTTPRTTLSIERQWGQLFGTSIRSYDSQRRLVCFAKAKAFKLREEITFFRDEAQTVPMFKTKARNILDIAATYDMYTNSGELFGSLRRKGIMSSFAQDHWLLLDAAGNQVGEVKEDSLFLGIVRRHIELVAYFLPQTYHVTFGETIVAEIKQHKNPFTVKYDYSIDSDKYTQYEMLFLAIANLLALIEARQN